MQHFICLKKTKANSNRAAALPISPLQKFCPSLTLQIIHYMNITLMFLVTDAFFKKNQTNNKTLGEDNSHYEKLSCQHSTKSCLNINCKNSTKGFLFS